MTTKPQPQQHVKILLNNGTLVEGIVESWTNDEVILISLDRESMLILPRPNEDILLIKIVLGGPKLEEPAEKPKRKPPTKRPLSKSELEQAFEAEVDKPTDTPGRTETLAELRIQLAEAERAIVAEKMQEHHVGNPSGTKYETIAGTPFRNIGHDRLKSMIRKRKS